VRIGTWNLAGRWTDDHRDFLDGLGCDVLLLTEVSEGLALPHLHVHLSTALMAQKRRWAGIASRTPLQPLPDPHPASAMARIGGRTYCSSILPWRSCGPDHPWLAGPHAAKTLHAVETLLDALPREDLVWGGDWNHALSGSESAGSKGGRAVVLDAVTRLRLQVPTAPLPHLLEGYLSIDHIAVPAGSDVRSATRHSAAVDGRRLSDHDAYVVDVALE
jgi:hypothetical protein